MTMKRYGIYVTHLPCLILVDGQWGNWCVYETCSKSCGSGTKVRTRHCDDPLPSNGGQSCVGDAHNEITCNTDTCPGNETLHAYIFINVESNFSLNQNDRISCNKKLNSS